jgi:protein ImuB
VLYADHGQRGLRVVFGSRHATRHGVRPGMPLAEAKGILGVVAGGIFLPHDPVADLAALEQLAIWCGRFSPFVGIEGDDALLIDLTGCVHLFGGEITLCRRITRAFRSWGLLMRLAIADTVGAAWACARYGDAGDAEIIIPPGQQADALHKLPIRALRLDEPVVEALEELGIDRVEQFLALPRTSLPARFGPRIIRQWDRAIGEVEELIKPVRPCDPVVLREDFEHATHDRKQLLHVLRRLISQLTGCLAERNAGLQRLDVEFFLENRGRQNLPLGLLRPSPSPAHVIDLLQLQLERFTLNAEVIGVKLHAVTIGLLEVHQAQLFESDDDFRSQRELSRLIDRLRGRLGEGQVVHPRLHADAQPELALRWEPVGNKTSTPERAVVRHRPLRLYQEPCPIEVMSVVPEGPPIRFFWDRQFHVVARYWGPERIETGWWRERPIRRDYYRVETQTGQRYWLFRRRAQEDWYLQGDFE